MRWLVALLCIPVLAGCLGPVDGVASADLPPGAIVAAAHPAAAQAGLDILAAGGNAVDAAIAVQFALNVVEPMMSGIGGGAFMLHWSQADGSLTALDGREVAPAAASPDMFAADSPLPPQERGIAVGVPGTLALLWQAHQEMGSMAWPGLVAPAVRLAADGVEVDEATHRYFLLAEEKLRRWPPAGEVFLQDAVCPPLVLSHLQVGDERVITPCQGGEVLPVGTLLVQPLLADTLALIAEDGPDPLYGGPLGENLMDAVALRDGRITQADLTGYAPVAREPLVMSWAGHDIVSLPLPSGGPVVQQVLGMYGDRPFDRQDPDDVHRLIEAIHLAFADRDAYHGDDAFVDVPLDTLLAPDYMAARAALIDEDHTGAPFAPGLEPAGPGTAIASGAHTTHFVVRDGRGDIVSMTSTIESIFGSGIMVPGRGFFLNNEMTDFDLEPGGPNEIQPDKRPRSSMSPTLVLAGGEPVLALGSPGGATIPGTVVQVMMDVLGGTPLQAAIDAPRFAALAGPAAYHEPEWLGRLLQDLGRRGHDWEEVTIIGGVQAVHFNGDAWVGGADARRSGAFGSV